MNIYFGRSILHQSRPISISLSFSLNREFVHIQSSSSQAGNPFFGSFAETSLAVLRMCACLTPCMADAWLGSRSAGTTLSLWSSPVLQRQFCREKKTLTRSRVIQEFGSGGWSLSSNTAGTGAHLLRVQVKWFTEFFNAARDFRKGFPILQHLCVYYILSEDFC